MSISESDFQAGRCLERQDAAWPVRERSPQLGRVDADDAPLTFRFHCSTYMYVYVVYMHVSVYVYLLD